MFSCYTGLRLSDVESLTWAEIVSTTGKHGQFTIVKEQAKTGETVVIPLSRQAMNVLQRQSIETKDSRAHGFVFKLKSRSQTKRYIHRWRTQSGIHFTYHSSRHTFGTMLQTAGVDINTTSKLMGHKSISMTLRYAKVVDKARESAISLLNSFTM
ncbi:site-specific integrase [Pontibacter liquoris]|uniref:site-specific integrase n=1 Tax=Pontibacter liquoris TaxID=2905677 RepID=UPI003462E4F9